MDNQAAISVLVLVCVVLGLAAPSAEAASLVFELTDFNFDKHVDGSGTWMLDIYAPCEWGGQRQRVFACTSSGQVPEGSACLLTPGRAFLQGADPAGSCIPSGKSWRKS